MISAAAVVLFCPIVAAGEARRGRRVAAAEQGAPASIHMKFLNAHY